MKFLITSVLSQLGQSLNSLAATLIFAHHLQPASFGILSAFWLAWMLLMSLLRSVFGEQVLVRGPAHHSSVGYIDFVLTLVAVALIGSVAAVLLSRNLVILPGLIYVAMFVASDAARYAKLSTSAEGASSRSLIVADGLRFVVTVAALVLLWVLDTSDLAVLCVCIAASVSLFLVRGVEGRLSLKRGWRYIRSAGAFEKQLIIQFLLGTGLAQSAPYLALLSFGPASLGALRLGQSILSPVTLVTTAFQPKLLVSMAAVGNLRSFRQSLIHAMWIFTFIACSLGVLVFSSFDAISDLILPTEFQQAVQQILLPIVVLLSLSVVGQPGGAAIRVLRLGQVSLVGQLIGVVVTIALAVMTLQASFTLFVWALAIGASTTVTASYVLLFLHLRMPRSSGDS